MNNIIHKLSHTLHAIWRWFLAHWKKFLGVCFKVAVIVIAVFLACVLVAVCYDQWDFHFGKRGQRLINQDNKIYVQYFADGTLRLKDLTTGRYTTQKILWAADEPARDSISVYCDLNGLRGFYNTHTGRIIIPGRYKHAWYFSEGVAGVVTSSGRLSFIDYDGNRAVPGSYRYYQGYDYVFHDGLCKVFNDSTSTCGLLRKNGTWALEPVYDWINEYSDGWRITCCDKGMQLWDACFHPVLDGYYESISIAEDNVGVYATRDLVKQLLDFGGNVIEPFIIDNTYPLKFMSEYNSDGSDEYEISPDVVVYQVNQWEGLMNKRTGEILTPAIYHDFELISPTLVRAQYEYYEGEGVVMDLRGRKVTNK